jgi:serine O-acetyltransferase
MTCLIFGSELGIACTIGGGLYIPHPVGIVIGICDIGSNVTILQNVTVGKKGRSEDSRPRIEDGVMLSAGSVVLGDITIGRDSVVGANSVVTHSVPPNSVAVGVPAKILSRGRDESGAALGRGSRSSIRSV